MSYSGDEDDDDYYEYDYDDIYWEEGPVGEAVSVFTPQHNSLTSPRRIIPSISADRKQQDDLAEHTMHSPIIVNYDPALLLDDYTDWDYDEDEDYYDDLQEEREYKRRNLLSEQGGTNTDALKLGKRKRGTQDSNPQKKRKLGATEDIPDLDLGETIVSGTGEKVDLRPVIVWRTKDTKPDIPVVKDGEGEKVSLLKDWRDRFKVASRPVNEKPKSTKTDAIGTQNTTPKRPRQKQTLQENDCDKEIMHRPTSTKSQSNTQGRKNTKGVEVAPPPGNVLTTRKVASRKRALEYDDNGRDGVGMEKTQPLGNATNPKRMAKEAPEAEKSGGKERGKGIKKSGEKTKPLDQQHTETRESKRLRKE